MPGDWFDIYHVRSSKNLARMLEGEVVALTGTDERIHDADLHVEKVLTVAVGIDSSGMFASIEVEGSIGPYLPGANEWSRWNLHANGTVTDHNDQFIGWHALKSMPGRDLVEGIRS
jgi:hypothetical protein